MADRPRAANGRTRRIFSGGAGIAAVLLLCGCASTTCTFEELTPRQVGAAVAEVGAGSPLPSIHGPAEVWTPAFRDTLRAGQSGVQEWSDASEVCIFISGKDNVRLGQRELRWDDGTRTDVAVLKVRSTRSVLICFMPATLWPRRDREREREIVRETIVILEREYPDLVVRPADEWSAE